MKTKTVFFIAILLIFLTSELVFGQDIRVHNLIGKPRTEIIKKYGNPVHQDNSNPDMICMFYETKTYRMIFISDNNSVYQAEASVYYDSEASARKIVDDFIGESVSDEFAVDTVSVNDFQFSKPGIKADLQIKENKITKNFDVTVKARRSAN
ncbi:MAG: hypothetical protein RBR74_00225 [Ignavibacteriaceae bacterium]|jgi:hypothetical protein|nr:hypothetical protein [Ignavibacteriaceae bacterium]